MHKLWLTFLPTRQRCVIIPLIPRSLNPIILNLVINESSNAVTAPCCVANSGALHRLQIVLVIPRLPFGANSDCHQSKFAYLLLQNTQRWGTSTLASCIFTNTRSAPCAKCGLRQPHMSAGIGSNDENRIPVQRIIHTLGRRYLWGVLIIVNGTALVVQGLPMGTSARSTIASLDRDHPYWPDPQS